MSAEQRLSTLASHLASLPTPLHPLDPLTAPEIEYVVCIVRNTHGQVGYNAITLAEPTKKEFQAWLADPTSTPRPKRRAEVVAIGKNAEIYDGIVDIGEGKIVGWEVLKGFQPLVSI